MTARAADSTTNAPRIRVVIPCKNSAWIIRRCLDGLVATDLPRTEFETWVVDTGSVDETLNVVAEYNNRLNLTVLSCSGSPIGAARNAGAAGSKTEYLAFLDSDCVPRTHWLRSGIENFEKNDALSVVGAPYEIPDDSTWVARTWYRYRQSKSGTASYLPGGNIFVRANAFMSLGGFSESLRTNEDYEFCQRAKDAEHTVSVGSNLTVCHFGEAQTLYEFYKKQRWHGCDVFPVFLRSLPRLRNLKPTLFGVYSAMCMVGSFLGLFLVALGKGGGFVLLLTSTSAACAGALAASGEYCVRRRSLTDFLPLAGLFLAFGVARGGCVLNVNNVIRSVLRPSN